MRNLLNEEALLIRNRINEFADSAGQYFDHHSQNDSYKALEQLQNIKKNTQIKIG